MSHAEEFDIHGHKDHGHVIVSAVTLRLVLATLLFFTLLTVGAALLENWAAHTFAVEIPNWMNVCIALSIAAVKTALVVLFFMQLKYDNPLNSMVFVFTLMTAVFFLGFTALDLAGRGTLDRAKAKYEVEGGTGAVKGSITEGQSGVPLTEAARKAAIAKGTYSAREAEEVMEEVTSTLEGQSITDAGYLRKPPKIGSSSNMSRPVHGITIPGLPGYKRPGQGEGEHPAEGAEHASAGAH